MGTVIDPREFDTCVKKLRTFFTGLGWTEVHTQCRLSILAACEDPQTLGSFHYSGNVWPLPQTNQMYLEEILLKDPSLKGVFCVSTSYRQEPNPVSGRHDLIFPLFEIESFGTMEDLLQVQKNLLQFLGFGVNAENGYKEGDYADVAKRYGVDELDHCHENQIDKDYGHVFFLKNFPEYTSPFFNMNRNDDGTSRKIDCILHGIECFGTAERSCDPVDMRKRFSTISDGGYANRLYADFGRDRVNNELDQFLSHNFFPRYGGGIGMTRLIRGMKLSGLL